MTKIFKTDPSEIPQDFYDLFKGDIDMLCGYKIPFIILFPEKNNSISLLGNVAQKRMVQTLLHSGMHIAENSFKDIN
jgi:hypothetical protein